MTQTKFLLLLALMLAVDVGITTYALTRPGFKEANPVVRWCIEHLGGLIPGQVIPKVGIVAVLYVVGKWTHHASDAAGVALYMFIGFVLLAFWNLYQLHKGGAL